MAPLFEALHRFGLLMARFGNFLVALGALVLGFAERTDPESPRWMAWLAWIAAAGGFAGVLLVPEASLLMLTAVTLVSGWSVGVGVWAPQGMTSEGRPKTSGGLTGVSVWATLTQLRRDYFGGALSSAVGPYIEGTFWSVRRR